MSEPPAGAGQPLTPAADFSVSTLPQAPAVAPGALGALGELPPALASTLTAKERLVAKHLAQGSTWSEACDLAKIKRGNSLRGSAPPRRVRNAADYLIQEAAHSCGLSRRWVLINCVSLYRRACGAEQVLDRSGRITGVWRFDGATAARMLELLGTEIGMFGKGKQPGIGVDQVAALLEAVATRGRRQLEPDRGRLIGESSMVPRGAAAPQQSEKALTDQQPIPADSSVISQELQGSPK